MARIFADEVGKQLSKGFGSFLDGDSVKVVVRFSQEIRPYVERKVWHPSQQSTELADGAGEEMHFVTTGVEAVKYWLYRWIPHVRIIEPEDLRLEMLDELKVQVAGLEKPGSESRKTD
jgi:hypothetical protein